MDEIMKSTSYSVAVILDTNVLDALPESLESGELSSLTSAVWRVFVPDVVAREWQWHRIQKAVESFKALRKSSKHLAQYPIGVLEADRPLPGTGTKIARELALRLRAAKLRVYRRPKILLRELTLRSVRHDPPFESANRGFKDELIVQTMLDIVTRWNWGACILVSNDGVFQRPEVRERFKGMMSKFLVVKNIKDAIQQLDQFIDSTSRARIAQDERRLMALASQHWDGVARQVQLKVLANGVDSYSLEEALKKISNFTVIEPIRVLQAYPSKVAGVTIGETDKADDRIRVTLRVDTRIELLARRNHILFYSPKVTTAGMVYPGIPEEETTVQPELEVSIEATVKADADAGFTDFNVVRGAEPETPLTT
jgi:hypothetical protein